MFGAIVTISFGPRDFREYLRTPLVHLTCYGGQCTMVDESPAYGGKPGFLFSRWTHKRPPLESAVLP